MIKLPNRVKQEGTYYSGSPLGYIDVSAGAALDNMSTFSDKATSDSWQDGDYLYVYFSVTDTINKIWLVTWDATNSYLVGVSEEETSGTMVDSSGVEVAAVLTSGSASLLSGIYSASSFGIQGALDAADDAGGGHVIVPDGIWDITTTLLIGSNTTLTLSPNATIRRGAAIDNMLRNKTTATAAYGANTNITVEGGKWDANYATYTDDVTIMAFAHSENITIRDTTLIDAVTDYHLHLSGVTNANISRTMFVCGSASSAGALRLSGVDGSSIYSWDTNFDETICSNIRIFSCVFDNTNIGVITDTETYTGNQSNIHISKCSFTNVSTGISALGWERCYIADNDISVSTNGIYIISSIADYLRAVNITGNFIVGASSSAIAILGHESLATPGKQCIADKNIIRFCEDGIVFTLLDVSSISSNNLDNVSGYQIAINQCNTCVVNANVIANVGTTYSPKKGITIGASTGSATDTAYNVITNNYTEAIDTRYADHTFITGNTVITAITNGGSATNTSTKNNLIAGTYTA